MHPRVPGYTGSVAPGIARRPLTTADYHSMIAAGIFGPGDRVELLAGEIWEAAAAGSRHASTVLRLNRRFSARVGDRALVSVQSPVELGPLSEPEPDLALLVPRADFYAARLPGPDDVLLLIEVADSSYAHDRDVKLPLYAAAGIPEVWIIDLAGRVIEVFRAPRAGGWQDVRRVRPRQTLAPSRLPNLALDPGELF